MPPKVLMLVGEWTETLEAWTPWLTLKSWGVTVDVVCPDKKKGEKVQTAVWDWTCCAPWETKPGHCLPITWNWTECDPKTYDALWLPGGKSPEWLRLNPKVNEIVKHFWDAQKPICATQWGPQLLVPCGIPGKKLTAFPTWEWECKLAGAEWVPVPNDECVVDGWLITAPTWLACPKMCAKLCEMMGCTWKWTA